MMIANFHWNINVSIIERLSRIETEMEVGFADRWRQLMKSDKPLESPFTSIGLSLLLTGDIQFLWLK
jgi:hypothetical protein